MTTLPNSARNAIVVLGLIQGLLLLLAQLLIPRGVVDGTNMVLLVPWYAIAIGVPTALQLSITEVRDRRLWLFGLGLAAVLGLTGAYIGYMIGTPIPVSSNSLLPPYILTTLIGWYVLLPFVQAVFKTGRLRPAYPDLFEFAWNNIITLLIAAAFTGIFWALLALWANLFKVIGIQIFADIFFHRYFVYPVTAATYAFALYLGRNNVSAVITVRRIILAIFKALLPLLALIILLFLLALPFMGLKPLWATGKATALMLALQIGLLIFLNAVFQNGQGEAPYTNWLRTLVRAAVILLPIYTVLCVYALYLRIDQHGWSTDRFWAAMLTLIVGLHVFGYAAVALRKNPVWMAGMATANIRIAATVVVLSVLVNSPLLDAHRISAASQVARLLNGKTAAAEFDYKYLRFELGRAGNTALAELKELRDHPQAPTIRRAAEAALNQGNPWAPLQENIMTIEQASAHFSVFPAGAKLDDAFLEYAIEKNASPEIKRCFELHQRCAVLLVDLNKDNQTEYVVFRIKSKWDRSTAVITRVENKWHLAGIRPRSPQDKIATLEELEQKLAKGNYKVTDSTWRELRIDGELQNFQLQ